VPFNNTHVVGLQGNGHVEHSAQVTHYLCEFLIIIGIRILDSGA
jgi:hypothetical protein